MNERIKNPYDLVPTFKSAPVKMTAEEFMIQWVLLRASFRTDFNGKSAVETAHQAWKRIQELKDK